MPVELDDIIRQLGSERMSLEAACQALSAAAQADPVKTRFWGQRIEAEMVQGRLSRPAARALFDALENFQCDRTMWLDPATAVPSVGAGPSSVSAKRKGRKPPPPIASIDQLRAELFRPATRPSAWARTQTESSVAGKSMQHGAVDQSAASAAASSFGEPAVPMGTVLNDRYRVVAPLGLGGVGQVFEAVDLNKSKEREFSVTVKIIAVNLRHQPHAYAGLEAAVRQAQPLVHPNIVAVYDIARAGDQVFLVMESLRGRWLSGLIREVRGSGLPYDRAWPIISGIAGGLAYAHGRGIVHSDLSPHAIFLCVDGTPKIMGFGLVHAVPNSNESLDVLDTLTLRAYTEAYTADPWNQQGAAHPADDLYPLGVIAYEMLAGKHPFQRCTLAVARQKALKLEPIPRLNRRARKLIERCLSFERNVRPQDGAMFLKRMRPNVFERMLAAGSG